MQQYSRWHRPACPHWMVGCCISASICCIHCGRFKLLIFELSVLAVRTLKHFVTCTDGFEAAHTFSAYANWIVPGKVMLGRYPYVERSRCRQPPFYSMPAVKSLCLTGA